MTNSSFKPRDVKAAARRLTQALDACAPKLSRTELAVKLAVTPGAVSHYLNGNRPCPEHIINKIAHITKVEPGWLMHGTASRDSTISAKEQLPSNSRKATSLRWAFRESPPDGGKDFGNAAVYATPMAVKTIVREDGQNSLDAAPRTDVVLRFRLVELAPETKRYARLLRAIRFDQLKERILAIENAKEFESKLGTKLIAGVETITDEKLTLLFIDDYGTRGLPGDETDSKMPFSALVRDNLNSRKEEQTAGGVFGLGAKVNIACSQLSTVIFASKIKGEEAKGVRVIGRSELTYHRLSEGRGTIQFAGPGWLGSVKRRPGLVDSVWVDDDDRLLDDLMMRRDRLPRGVRRGDAAGTSIMVVGFSDPQSEMGGSTQQLADAFAEAAAVNFWPAMMRGSLTVWVERYVGDDEEPVKREQVDPRNVAGIRELCDAWEKHASGRETPVLTSPGDVSSVVIPLVIPATKARAKGVTPHDEVVADCALVVRLAEPEEVAGDPRASRVAYIRGRAMVTRYQARASVVGGRAFHAALLAGTLLGNTSEQDAAEQFLRMAEPPAHDKWTFNADLGERYVRGGKKSLDEFHARVTEQLQRLLRAPLSRADEGPEALRRLLQFGSPKSATTQQPQIRILSSTAVVIDGAWSIQADISITPLSRTLQLSPRLSFQTEGGSPIPVKWATLSAHTNGVEVSEDTLVLKPRTKLVSFRGSSDPTSHPIDARDSSVILDVLAHAERDR